MRGRKNRIYHEGSAHHLYLKALDGNVLFYRTEDFVFYITLLFVLAKRYGVGIEAISIMFNHTHSFVKPVSRSAFEAFRRDLQSIFSIMHNKEYGETGTLMMPSGYAPKSSQKSILSCLIYILNNPVTGKLTQRAIDYKWNLLAYVRNDHPFSERLIKRNSSSRMRKALKIIDICFKKGLYLDYAIQRQIYKGLTSEEKVQAVDYIVNKYNPVDKDCLKSRFGSFETALRAMDSTTGADHDIAEPWEDYSIYAKMLRLSMRSGIDLHGFRFNEIPENDLIRLVQLLLSVPNSTIVHLRRFLRLPLSSEVPCFVND